jgi:hypothetical protein
MKVKVYVFFFLILVILCKALSLPLAKQSALLLTELRKVD